MSPGPAVLLVLSLGLTRGAGRGFVAGMGVLSANAVYFVLSATGLGTILLTTPDVFVAIKWAGTTYLLWLGLNMLLANRNRPGREPQRLMVTARGAFLQGFLTQVANHRRFRQALDEVCFSS